jgi:hypothetical protein
MAKVMYTNHSDHVKHVGSKAIGPGESREVDARDLPGYRAAKAQADTPDPLREGVDRILAHAAGQIGEMLPALSDEELAAVLEAERTKGKKARRTVVQALEAERLRRASQDQDSGDQGKASAEGAQA